MAKTYITLDTRIDTWKDEFNNLVNKVGDLGQLTTSGSGDSDLVQAINEHSAELGAITASDMSTTASTVSTAIKEHALELGTITAGAMGTTASTVSTAIAELDAEADSDRSNFANNVRTIMLDPAGTGTSREVTASANNSTNETTFLTFVDGATGSQGIETDTGLTYNPSTGNLVIGGELAAATLDISGNVDIDGTLEVGAISGTSADFDAGVTIDNLTIDGTSVASSSTLSLDAAGDITIDAGGAEINLKDDGTTVGHISMASSNLEIKSSVSDKDMIFKGNDGGSEITALTFDMSNAGKATFNNAVTTGAVITSGAGLVIADDGTIGPASDADAIQLNADGTMTMSGGDLKLKHDGSILMFGANDDVTLTHVHDTGLLLNGTMALQFNDASQNINAPSNTVLDINATDEIELNATLVDINANLDVSGTVTATGTSVFATLDISGDVDIDGTLEADAITLAGVTLAETISDTVGGMVGSNTETGITVTYEDADNTLDFVMGTTQTTITSLTNAALVVGRDADNDIDFATDNNIIFRAAGADQIRLQDGALVPVTDNDIDLGTSSLEFKDAYFDGTVTADAFAGPLTGNVTGNASGTAGVGTLVTVQAEDTENSNRFVAFVDAQTGNNSVKTDTQLTYNPNTNTMVTNITGNVTGNLTGQLTGSGTEQGSITSLGTLTALQVDNININGNDIISTDTNGDINITPQGDGDILLDGNVNIRAGVITGVTSITATNLTGLASNSTKLATPRAFSITGDVTASAVNFDGTAVVTLDTSIANNAVVTASINADAVTNTKIADDAVDTENIADDAITAPLIDDGAVGTAALATNAVTTIKITDENVTLAKIENITGNSVLVRNASSSGVVSAKAVADTEILIGDGTGFVNEPLTGDLTMANTGVITMAAAQTNITSLLATDLIIGEDAQTAIDFGTADEIDFKVANAVRLTMTAGAIIPATNNQIDLGTSSLEFKDAFFDGTVTSDAFAGPLTGNVTGNVSGTALTVTQAAQSAITSLGTLTALTVDDITINGSTISDGGDLTVDVGGDITLDADGGQVYLKDAGSLFGEFKYSDTAGSSDFDFFDIKAWGNASSNADHSTVRLFSGDNEAARFTSNGTTSSGQTTLNYHII